MSKDDLPILNFPKHRKVMRQFIDGLEGNYRIEFTKVMKGRTLAQNAYMHGVVFYWVAQGLKSAWGENVSMLQDKALMKDEFLRVPQVNKNTGEIEGYYTRGTSELNVSECIEFIEKVIDYAATKLNVTIPPAGDYEVKECA